MDLDPAAVEAAAFTLANVAVLPAWMQKAALGRDMTPIAEIAVAAAAPLIARATADAIADKIEAERNKLLYDGQHLLYNTTERTIFRWAADLARSFPGSQAETTTEETL